MYSFNFNSFINRFKNLGQEKTEAREKPTQAKKQTTYIKIKKHTKDSLNQTFLRGTKDQYQQYIKPDRDPTPVRNYTDRLKSGPTDYTKQVAWQRANTLGPNQIDYTKPNAWQAMNRKLSSTINLFNSAIRNPFGQSNNNNGAYSWA